jgi:hypothetical protein
VTSLFIGSHINHGTIFTRKNIPFIVLVGIALAMSDIHTWWGPFLQIGASVSGFLLGQHAKSEMRDIPGILLIIMATTTTVLMQPEFFRFGQLGNLTWLHMIAIMFVGTLVAATVAVRNITPMERIHHSAYIKLKWMIRFVVMLGMAVFMMTESIPVFLGTFVAMFVLFAMSVWHSKSVSATIEHKLYALTILSFGVIITMPVIVAIGIVYLANLPNGNLWSETKYLL